MAAPTGRWICQKMRPLMHRLFFKNSMNIPVTPLKVSISTQRIAQDGSHHCNLLQTLRKVIFSSNRTLRIGPVSSVCLSSTSPSVNHGAGPRMSSALFAERKALPSTQQSRCINSSSDKEGGPFVPDNRNDDNDGEHVLKLMDFPARIWPHPIKTLRNLFLSILIRGYMDRTFTPAYFLKGAEQGMLAVSNLVSSGNFDDLEGLVSRECVQEVRHNYHKLSSKQHKFIAVDPKDIFYKFIYEVGMIFDDKTDQRFVEITAVFHGIHGMHENMENFDRSKAESQMFVCNYRFIREYTKGLEEDTDWTVNVVNHFMPKEVAKHTDMFTR